MSTKTTVKPQHDHDWQLVISNGHSFYTGGGEPGFGWTTYLWTARKFQCMSDIRKELAKWSGRDIPRKVTIQRVWICPGEVRATFETMGETKNFDFCKY